MTKSFVAPRLTWLQLGYYNTWTEEVPDVSETDEETTSTEIATTEDSVSKMSPGTGPNIEFGVSTGGLDFMSSSGYPQIEFGYDDASDKDEESDDEDENSTSPDDQDANGGEGRNNLVSCNLFLRQRCFFP
jgi:translation initiation factor 2-alpha kinase 4